MSSIVVPIAEVRSIIVTMMNTRLRFLRYLLVSAIQYSTRYIKNCIKFSIGIKTSYTLRETFFQKNFFRLFRGPLRITCYRDKEEGPGSQCLMTMAAIAFARSSGMQYVHTPFTEISHADRPMNEWVEIWEANFNLGVGEVQATDVSAQVFNFGNNFWLFWTREIVDNYDLIISDFRRKYYLNKVQRPRSVLTVAVHIRRGDVTCDNVLWTDSEVYRKIINTLKQIFVDNHLNYRIYIFSQGNTLDFVELMFPSDVQLMLDTDPILTMQELVEADVLVMAKSTFSYVAAVLSKGVKIYEPFGCPPQRDWIIRSPDGNFPVKEFEQQLNSLSISEVSGPSDLAPLN